ncbi:MAG: DUF5665 domain-containing protein [Candidatus Shapirobacteria bacterium]|nr:DUF5665 domain-containing protein [Candidatus Shapirobacteria bacterium]
MKINYKSLFLERFLGGVFWAIGVTFGFAIIITLLTMILKWLGGLPFIGEFFANIIHNVNKALEIRNSAIILNR